MSRESLMIFLLTAVPPTVVHAIPLTVATDPPSACLRLADCEALPVLSHPPRRYPVSLKVEELEILVSLDDCLAMAKEPIPEIEWQLAQVFQHVAVVREVLPSTRTIDLGERPSSTVNGFMTQALRRGVAFLIDRRSRTPVSELTVCKWSDVHPCEPRSRVVCGCSGQSYCLPDGRLVLAVAGVCS